jgi:hypothetical protein
VAVPAHDGVSVCLLGCAHPFAWVTKRLTVCTLCLCSGTQPHYSVLSVRAARIHSPRVFDPDLTARSLTVRRQRRDTSS